MLSEYEEELQELAWYPRKKIEIVKYKLNGLNPVKILERELKESKHDKRVRLLQLTILFIALHKGTDASSKGTLGQLKTVVLDLLSAAIHKSDEVGVI